MLSSHSKSDLSVRSTIPLLIIHSATISNPQAIPLLITAYIASFICPAIVPLLERHPCFSLASKVIFSPAGCLPQIADKRIKKENSFSKKREKRNQRFVSGSQKGKLSPTGVEKNLHPMGSIFLHKLAF